jgi:pilus assembly protein Flp/PilA
MVLRFVKDEEGPTAVEYAVMLAMIILLCIIIIRQLGTTTSQSFSAANSAINAS